jgi:hypothetical protein
VVDDGPRRVEYRTASPAHQAALVVLPWVIAALPLTLLVISILIGVWPHPITLITHIVIVFIAVAVDVRVLLRAGASMSVLYAIPTPAYYLYRRAWTTGRERLTVILGTVTTTIWILAVAFAAINFVDQSSREPGVEILGAAGSVVSDSVTLGNALSTQLTEPSEDGLATIQDAAEEVSDSVEVLETVTDTYSVSDADQDGLDAIRETAGRVQEAADDLAQAETTLEVETLQCPLGPAVRDFVQAVAGFLESGGRLGADEWKDAAADWEANTPSC